MKKRSNAPAWGWRTIPALLLCVLLLLPLGGCASNDGGPEETLPEEETTLREPPEGSVSVPYLAEDSLNPFYVETVTNAALVSLYCRSLYTLDTGFNAVNDIAQSQIVSVENVKVNLRQDVLFSDGSPVTAEDVVYSFEAARRSGLYAEQIGNIDSCDAPDERTVLFSLESPDVNALNALIFPVVKKGTADRAEDLPVSCGHYRFSQDGIRTSLVCNTEYAGDLPPVGTVRLTEVTENTVLETLVDAGEISFCYSDLSHGSAKRTYASVTDVYLNNLVFIGVNKKNVNFGVAEMRRALSLALDRQEIVSAGFQSFARAAVIPFNTSWTAVAESAAAAELNFNADLEAAEALLAPYGAGTGRTECFVTLLCPESNSFLRNTADVIVKQLAAVNVTVTVETVDRYDYHEALETGKFDMYLGEIKLSPTMSLDPFFNDGAASYGIDTEEGEIADSYYRYRGGELDLDGFIGTFTDVTPFIPLCYRNGRMCYTSDASAVSGVSEFCLFGSIDRWQIDTEHAQG